ncbi:hypothetical protein N7493_008412 [Penicillium malachiteum]|uniref:Uncharacterized protein n=1 Tax=Penicillium malachiteum TaxID=1324776 RepID=A0AAD6MTR6_9EURO|nr:hypothetical protein N7493_008412 [Penicillium malachiteum]
MNPDFPLGTKCWVHLVFNLKQDKGKSDWDVVETARDLVLHGKTHETATANLDGIHDLDLIWEPILSIQVPVPSTDFVDLLRACDRILENWRDDLKSGIWLPFDTRLLFKAPGMYNQIALGVYWDEVCGTYGHHEVAIRRAKGR